MIRFIGAALLIAGAAGLAWDVASWLGGAGFRLHAVGEAWFALHRDSLQLAQPALERHVAPFLWDPVMLTILEAPVVAIGGVGLALLVLARR